MTMCKTILAAAMLTLIGAQANANDYLLKQKCTLSFKGRALLHTTCLIKGGMSDGAIDDSIKTPDGKTYALEGPVDGMDGHKYLLQGHPAKITSIDGGIETCYARNDGALEICTTSAEQ